MMSFLCWNVSFFRIHIITLSPFSITGLYHSYFTLIRANGLLCFGPSTFVSVAFILSMFAQWRCNYVNTGDLSTGGFIFNQSVKTVGIHCWQTVGGVNYKYGSDFDTMNDDVTTIQNLSIATTTMGGISWLVFFVASCCRFPSALWLLVGLVLAATAVTEGLVFQQVFGSDFCTEGGDMCEWGTGARCAISAMAFWGISSLMTCAMFKDAKDRDNEGNDGE